MSSNYVDKHIQEAEVRFEEKYLAAKRGEVLSVANNVGEKMHNLRAQIQGQPLLESDSHLMTMISDSEKYSNYDYVVKGDANRKLTHTVTSLLKALLRDVVSTADLGLRKINIEKCWNWYKDKMKLVIDWKLERMGSPSPPDSPAKPQKTVRTIDNTEPVQGKLRTETAKVLRKPHVNYVVRNQPGLGLDFKVKAEDAQEKTGITKKLERHLENLAANMLSRKEARESSNVIKTALGEQVPPVTETVEEAPAQKPRSKWRPKEHDEPTPPPPPPPLRQYPRVVYKQDTPGSKKSKGPPTFLHARNGLAPEMERLVPNGKDEVVSADLAQAKELLGLGKEEEQREWSNMQKTWIQNEGTATDETLEPLERALANTQKMWVAARAKEVEELHEEKEFHDTITLWAYNHARVEEEIHRKQESSTTASQIGRTHHLILAKRPGTAKPPAPGHSLLGDGTVNPSLSAYDHRLATGYEMILEEKDKALSRKTPDDGMLQHFKEYGIKPVNSELLVGTGGTHIELDVIKDKHTAFAPSIERQTYMPPRANSAPPARGEDKKKTKKKGKGKGKGKKAAAAANAVQGEKRLTEEELQRKVAIFQWLFPSMTTVEEVPSLERLKQLKTVETIKQTLAKNSVHVPLSVIEKGILTPEYQPYLDCVRNLPSREQGFCKESLLMPSAKAKTKAPSKKKKKKSKKK